MESANLDNFSQFAHFRTLKRIPNALKLKRSAGNELPNGHKIARRRKRKNLIKNTRSDGSDKSERHKENMRNGGKKARGDCRASETEKRARENK